MDFFKRLFQTAKRTYNPAQWTTLYPTDVIERNLLENNKEWVFISVDKVAKAVATVRFKVMRYERNGDDQEVFDGPLVDFLEAPASDFTGKDFIYLDTAYKELTGNAFWEITKKTNLAPLIPTSVSPVITDGKLTGFRYTGEGKERTISLDKVLHDRYIDPRKPYWGVGKLEKIARWVDTSSYANEFLRLFFVNGAQFGGFIKTEEESEDRIKLIKIGLANEHVGVQNAHRIAVLPKGADFKEATATMADMQFNELDEKYRDKILSAFGVPKTLVGFTTEVNRASAEASEYIFAKYTVKPIVDDFIEFLNYKVAPLFDNSGKFYFAYDEFVPENVEMKIRERESALNKQPYMTVNEVRATVGLPPVDGGDVIYSSPGTVIGEKPPLPTIAPAGDKPEKAAPRRIRAAARKERLIDELVTRVAEVAESHDPDAESYKQFVSRVEAYEAMIEEKVKDFNNQQERDVVLRLQHIVKAVSKSELFDMDAEIGVLVDFVSPLLKGLLTEQAIAEYLAQGFDGQFDTNAEIVARIVDLAAKRMATSYNDTTAELLKKALNDGIAAGEGIADLTRRVREIYAFSDAVRAKAVARTETFYVANEASREAYRQSGVVKSLRWYTEPGACEFCRPMNGKVVGITETFFKKGDTVTGEDGGTMTTDYRAVDVPPLHTNCRCFVRPETIEV